MDSAMEAALQDNERCSEEIVIEDMVKFKEAFDFFDWNHNNTIPASVSPQHSKHLLDHPGKGYT